MDVNTGRSVDVGKKTSSGVTVCTFRGPKLDVQNDVQKTSFRRVFAQWGVSDLFNSWVRIILIM